MSSTNRSPPSSGNGTASGRIIVGVVAINGNAGLRNHRGWEPRNRRRNPWKRLHATVNDRRLANCSRFCPPDSPFFPFILHSLPFSFPPLYLSFFTVVFFITVLRPLNCLDNCTAALTFMRYPVHGPTELPIKSQVVGRESFKISCLWILSSSSRDFTGLSLFQQSTFVKNYSCIWNSFPLIKSFENF